MFLHVLNHFIRCIWWSWQFWWMRRWSRRKRRWKRIWRKGWWTWWCVLVVIVFSKLLFDQCIFPVPGGHGCCGHGDRGGHGAPGGCGGCGGRGGHRGGGHGGTKGSSNTVLEPHQHPGIFITKGTKNLVPSESIYGEKRISIESGVQGMKTEYCVWNPFYSKLATGVLGGLDNIFIKPGAASGTSVSCFADIVGPVCLFFYR